MSERKWCQPGDVRERQWLLVFDDADRSTATYTDEAEAREAFRRANEGGWNCYLFAAAEADNELGQLINKALT